MIIPSSFLVDVYLLNGVNRRKASNFRFIISLYSAERSKCGTSGSVCLAMTVLCHGSLGWLSVAYVNYVL